MYMYMNVYEFPVFRTSIRFRDVQAKRHRQYKSSTSNVKKKRQRNVEFSQLQI